MTKYVVGLGPFPKRWQDHLGKVTVMGEPIKGYVMVRRPGGFPFVLSVSHLLNAEEHHTHGPFSLLEPARRSPQDTAHD